MKIPNKKKMLKYANVQVVFQEFPGETTLAINITNCPNHCPGCHSPHLWKDEGYPLNEHGLETLLRSYNEPGVITCVGFMGGDQDCNRVQQLAQWVKMNYPHLKTGWYSGNNFWSDEMMEIFDYVKFGSYKKDLGGLDSPTTNQVMYKHIYNDSGTFSMWLNITKYFWKDTPKELKEVYLKTTYNSIAIIHQAASKTSLFEMPGLTVDGYETKMEPIPEENFVKGYIMTLNGQVSPEECMPQEYRRKWGSNDKWEKVKKKLVRIPALLVIYTYKEERNINTPEKWNKRV